MNWKNGIPLAWVLVLLLLLPSIQSLQIETSIQACEREKQGGYNHSAIARVQSTSTVHHSGLPKVDEILFKAYPGATPDRIVQGFLDGETDWIRGPYRSDLFQDVVNAGHKVSEMCSEAEFTFFPINCRDYKYSSGEPNTPLNDSNWRLALSYIYGMDDKQDDIYGYYGVPWQEALGNPVPPAQKPWYDAATQMPDSDNGTAWAILSGAGYSIADYGGQQWLHKNGVPVRPPDGPNGGIIDFWYSGSLVYPDGPGGGMVRNFNAFIQDYLDAEGPIMELVPMDFTTLVVDLLAVRDYDIIGIGLVNLGKFVDWIYDCFHSDNDVPWGWNFCGIHDDDFDRWSEIIVTSLDTGEVIEATENFSRKFVNELMPWMPAIMGLSFCTTARDGRGELMNVVPMDNYGPMNDWSYIAVHWKGEPDVAWPGGNVTVALEDKPYYLNPWTDDTACSWEIMGRSIVSLLMVEPGNLMNMPFVAADWESEYWTSIPELGVVNGCQCTFWLRQDVKWHDGRPVTAYDCVENIRFLRSTNPGVYCSPGGYCTSPLVYEEAISPYKFSVYSASTPSLSYADYVTKSALLAPKHIIKVVEDYWDTWDPSQLDYGDLGLGPPPAEYPFMKQLVGCGPFVFDYYDRNQAIGRVERYQDFFVNAPVISSIVGEWRINPLDSYIYRLLVQNLAAVKADGNGTITDVTVGVKIYEDNVLAYEVYSLHLDQWNWTYLESYTVEGVACGLHNVTVEVYDHADSSLLHSYTHTYVATVREDLSTYTGELLDFMVDIRDVSRGAKAFGSSPGHHRWDSACDVNHDFTVDIRDISAIARKFGWSCP